MRVAMTWARAFLLLCAFALFAGAGPAPLGADQATEGGSMANLNLALEADRTAWISGETPLLRVVLTNAGAAPVMVPSVESGGFLTLTLTNLESEEVAVYKMGGPKRQRRPDRRGPPLWMEEVQLAPGASLRYGINMDAYAPELPKVGAYALGVTLASGDLKVATPAMNIAVTPLRAATFASVTDVENQSLTQVAMHESDDGMVALARRSIALTPAAGGFRRLGEGLAVDASAAIAMPLRPLLSHTHVATLSNGVLRAGLLATPTRHEAALDLTDAALHPFGWQVDTWTAEYLALGRSAAGAVAAIITVNAPDGVTVDLVDLPLAAVPAMWRARRAPDAPLWSLVVAGDASGAVLHLTLERTGASAVEPWTKGPGPVSVMAMHPVAPASAEVVAAIPSGEPNYARAAAADAVDIVFGPYQSDGRSHFSLNRISAVDGAAVRGRTFPAPHSADGATLEWSLSLDTGPEPYAAVLLGGRLIGIGFEGPVEVLTDDLEGTHALTFDAFNGGFAIGWVNSDGNPIIVGK
jgi:hypothetical protein